MEKQLELKVSQWSVLKSLVNQNAGNITIKDAKLLKGLKDKITSVIPKTSPLDNPPKFDKPANGAEYSQEEMAAFQPVIESWNNEVKEYMNAPASIELADNEVLILRERLSTAKFNDAGEEFRENLVDMSDKLGV